MSGLSGSVLERIPEQPGAGRTGRHVWHDPRSRDHDIEREVTVTKLHSVVWPRRVPPFDQGDLGSCTGNSGAGVLATDNAGGKGATGVFIPSDVKDGGPVGMVPVDEKLAVRLYSLGTHYDPWPQTYLPDDTGSTGNAVSKAMRNLGLISRYSWAFTLSGAVKALQRGPIMIGIPWMASFDEPDRTGLISSFAGGERGGHEIEVIGVDLEHDEIILCNSWGERGWTSFVPKGCEGVGGYFRMKMDVFAKALQHQGDVTVPILGQV